MSPRTSIFPLFCSLCCLLGGCAEERGAPPQEIIDQQMGAGSGVYGEKKSPKVWTDEEENQQFKATDHFTEYDKNADGKLTEKEIEEWMKEADADKNGEITQEELANWKPPAGTSGAGAAGPGGAKGAKQGGFGSGAAGTATGEGTPNQ